MPRSVHNVSPCGPTTDNSLIGPAVKGSAAAARLWLAAVVGAALRQSVQHGHGAADLDLDIAERPGGGRDFGLALLLQPAETQNTGPAVTKMPSTAASRLYSLNRLNLIPASLQDQACPGGVKAGLAERFLVTVDG